MIKRMSIFAAAAMLILTGCSSFDGQKARQEHVDSYRSLLAEQAEEEIIAQAPLTLDDCLRIAMENNLNVRVAEVQ